jgi:NADH-quinone oxidoreductase subunit K
MSVYHYMTVSAILFALGTYGVLTRRNAIVIFMCIELMLNSVNLTFIALSRHLNNLDGQIFVFFVMTVAAAEAAVGLALMIAFFRNRESIDVEDINLLKW